MTTNSRAVVALRPRMPTVDAHRALLIDAIGTTYNSPRLQLVPRDALPEIISELKAGMAAAPEKGLKREIARLAASYPQAAPPSASGWLQGMVEEASGYPLDVAEETVRRLRRTCKFLPSIAEFVEIADGLMGERKAALYRAQAMLRRHAELDAEEERQRQLDAERSAGEARESRLLALLNRLDWGNGDAQTWLHQLRFPASYHVRWGHAAAEADGMPEDELLELLRAARDREDGAFARLEQLHTSVPDLHPAGAAGQRA